MLSLYLFTSLQNRPGSSGAEKRQQTLPNLLHVALHQYEHCSVSESVRPCVEERLTVLPADSAQVL